MDAEQTARRTAQQTAGQAARRTAEQTARQAPERPTRQSTPARSRRERPADRTRRERPTDPPHTERPTGQPRTERPTGQPRTGARGALGRYGEQLAARRLTEAGMTILERNWRAGRTGEIDIVAQDGDTLVICEVKTRRAGSFEHPMAAVTPIKAERLRGLAERWLQAHGSAPPGGVRIDLVGIVVPDRGAPQVEHARGVA